MNGARRVNRAIVVLGVVAIVLGAVGLGFAAGKGQAGKLVAIGGYELQLYQLNWVGAALLILIGVLALLGSALRNLTLVWVAAGVSAVGLVVGLATWRSGSTSLFGFDGRAASLLLLLAVGLCTLAWVTPAEDTAG